ncbi:FGGY-family carbohydrate kinase [Dyella flava]|uniref:FGGY-family carbohydrate kinase n=1 Tax=Dyella flava TaxID=1920170 RepID=A0ABS2K2U3_9GAMM|nr:FGGY-family carbohydrate kinase [Dyella flava]MBM7125519.1 FGGY-family carbohydrate kinase [Dyella flava]GLQ51619.1 carbohydrate kinase [Dyella flava]
MPSVPPAITPSRNERLVLAVDLGTSGCKVALIGMDGSVLAWTFRPVALHLVDELGVEQDPQDWWHAFVDGAQELLTADTRRRRHVVAVCCSTFGECTIPVDKHGNALTRAMLWVDMRGAEAIRRRARRGRLNIQGYGPLRLARWLRLTGGAPSLSGKDPAGHIAWLYDHQPSLVERTSKFLNALDFMNLRLTGRFCATYDSALTTWATDNRDLAQVRYDARLLRQLGIEREKLPELVHSTDVIGPLLPAVAETLGLAPDTQVIAGAIDNSAAAIGAGTVRDGELHLYLGTSSWLGAHMAQKRTRISTFIASLPCAQRDRYLAMAMQTTACGNLSFLRDRILFHADELLVDDPRTDVYPLLDRIADRVPPGSRGLIYMPWLLGERTPVDDRHLRAGLFNLSLEHTREDMIRAFLEGVALNTRWMLEPMLDFVAGRRGAAITIVGGGGQSDVWCQMIADITGMVIQQPQAPIQANALGAAFIAGIGLGELSFQDVPALCRHRHRFEPRLALRQLYDDCFATFKQLHRQLAPLYRRLNQHRSPPR